MTLTNYVKPHTSSMTWLGPDDIKAAAYEWADRMNINLLQFRIRSMSRKWASISTIGRLTLSDDLLKIPKELGEFEIIHELVHLLVPNHGKVFKSFMLAYLPHWEEKSSCCKDIEKLVLASNGNRFCRYQKVVKI